MGILILLWQDNEKVLQAQAIDPLFCPRPKPRDMNSVRRNYKSRPAIAFSSALKKSW